MNIIVCIKQVPDTKNVRLDPKTNTLKREGVASIVNPYDMFAVEAALRIKEETGGKVTAITMGPPQAREALLKTVEYGVDEVVLLSDRAFAGADTWATSYALAKGIEKIGAFDVIVCGKQAIDGDTAQVGPGLAVQLGLPYVSFVKKISKVDQAGGVIVVERMMDDGYDVVEIPLPSLITVVKEVGELRVPSLRGKMKARKMEVPVMDAEHIKADPDSIGLAGSPTQVIEVFAPQGRGSKTVIEGSPDEQAGMLLSLLKQNKILGIGEEK